MNNTKMIRGLQLSAVLALSLSAGFSTVRADDTEVFFPQNSSTLGTQNPNLLFMIDTSGSMACARGVVIDGGSGNICAADTDPQPRMERLKSALIQVLDDLPSSLNVGLGRFSGSSGGAILFPVAGIDATLASVVGNTINVDAYTSGFEGSEAEEDLTGGAITFAPAVSPAVSVRVGAYDPVTTTSTVTTPGTARSNKAYPISDNFDTAEEWANGTIETGNKTGLASRRCYVADSNSSGLQGILEMFWNPVTYTNAANKGCVDGVATTGTPGKQVLGLRFSAVDIPKNATIVSASLQLTSNLSSGSGTSPSGNAGNVNYVILGESVANSPAFSINKTLSNTLSVRMPSGKNSFQLNAGSTPAVNQVVTLTDGSSTDTVTVNNISGSPAVYSITPNSGTRYNISGGGTTVSWSVPNTNNLSNRVSAAATTAKLVSSISGSAGGNTSFTFNVKPIIQEIFNRPDWNPGSTSAPMTLFITDDPANPTAANARRFINTSVIGGSFTNFPTLLVTYDVPTSTTTTTTTTTPHKMLTGLRFENVQIPRGADVKHAYLELRARGSQTLSPAISLTVTAHTSGDSPQIQQTASDISSRASTASSVSWALPGSVSDEDSVISPDLKDVVKAITDASGWCGGNALTLKLDGTPTAGAANGNRFSAYSNSEYVVIDSLSEDVVKDGPILHIELDATDSKLSGATAGCANGRAVNAVALNNDDAEEQRTGGSIGSVSLSGDDLELGFDTNQQLVAVRFAEVRVPQGSTILSASLEFTAKAASSGAAGLKISAINSGDTGPLASTTSALSGLSPKTATVDWNTSGGTLTDWADNTVYSTPDLTAVVQSVVNNGGWAEGNNMTFLVEADCPASNTTCRRRAYSRDGKTSGAPKLKIKYSGSAIALTVREELKRLVLDLPASGATPSAPALYEAARYFRGEAAYYGRTRGAGPGNSTSGAARTNRISHLKTFTAASAQTAPVRSLTTCKDFNPGADDCKDEHWEGTTVYKTPIVNACSSNNLIFFTDGTPNTLNNSGSQIRALPSPALSSCLANAQAPGGDCVRDLAKFLHEQDQSTSTVGGNLSGTQTVTTHTVLLGFAAGSPQDTWLKQVSANGGGTSYLGNSASELATAFSAIVSSILDINTTFTAPAVTVNTLNRLTNRNELYFALFNPAAQIKWDGNVKKYKLKLIGTDIKIVDTNDAEAVDPATDFFKDTSQSVWSDVTDGKDVTLGGFAGELTNTRAFYTYTGANKTPAATVTPFDLSTSALNPSNNSITNAMIGVPVTGDTTVDAAARTDVLNWARGIDVDDDNSDNSTTDARKRLGDPLHSQPLLISYKNTNDSDLTNDDITLFYGDNEGAIHAVNTATGAPIFSFIPKETLVNLNSYRKNIGSYSARPYGIDGAITKLHRDLNGDLEVLASSGVAQTTGTRSEFVYLYAGMRRGGRNYYSLDVTDRTAPKLRWVIYGGSGDYAELGQTWSDAVVRRIKYKGAIREVIIFTGGYDPDADGSIKLKDDADMGRAVYIADALTGERLWWASASGADTNISSMKFSIPASPKVLDLDNDGLADRIYVADAGGQIFRFELKTNHAATDNAAALITLGERIAVLSDAATAEASRTEAGARRYFAPPDVALIQTASQRFLSVAIGSGFREKPNNTTVEDRFYVLRDPNVTQGSASALAITESDLFDTTDNLIQQGTSSQKTTAQVALDGSKGFYIRMVNSGNSFVGEKVFNESLTLNSIISFTSFTPNITSSACTTVAGQSRLYQISAADGGAAVDYSSSSTAPPSCKTTACDKADRSLVLAVQGLPSKPAFIFTDDGMLEVVGAHANKGDKGAPVTKVYWLKSN